VFLSAFETDETSTLGTSFAGKCALLSAFDTISVGHGLLARDVVFVFTLSVIVH
jgi:hypothetical protein